MTEVLIAFGVGVFAGWLFTWQHYDHKEARREHRLFMAQSRERIGRLLGEGTSMKLVQGGRK